MKETRIAAVEPILWDRWLLLTVVCEDGTVGIGEGGVHGWQRPTATMLEVMGSYLVGQDPARIEHHYQWLYRSSHFMRPDLCLCGGLSGCKKVAALAEASHVKVIPHNPLSPVSTAACVQLDAAIPNFALQEYTGESEPPKSELLKTPLVLEQGHLLVPDRPGLGIELADDALARYPVQDKTLATPLGHDGSVRDW